MFQLSKAKSINFLKLLKYPRKFYRQLPMVKKRHQAKILYRILQISGIVIIGILVFIFLAFIIHFGNIKKVAVFSLDGKRNAELAVENIKKYNFNEAGNSATEAKVNFLASEQILNSYKDSFFLNFSFIKKQFNEVKTLIETAEILSDTLLEISEIGKNFDKLLYNKESGFSKMSKNEKQELFKRIYEQIPDLYGVKANIELALLNFQNIKARGVLFPIQNDILTLEENLKKISILFADAMPIIEMVPFLAGYPEESNFLVLLQNNDELRPTGGFIGTFGVLKTFSGDINSFITHDIYHLDMPVADKLSVNPPEPLRKYLGVDKWFMRDANWSPDWPIAARQANWFYHQESPLLPAKDRLEDFVDMFAGVIGITPALIEDLLRITGPLVIDGEEYNADNFHMLLQYKVEKGYTIVGTPSWHRKEVIGEIAKELKIRIIDKPTIEFSEIFKVLKDNLDQKNILLFFYDSHYQEIIKNQGWGGNIQDTKDDYFFIVDANMASLKTDAVISRSITYNLEQQQNQTLANLFINYKHNGELDWRTTRYRTYTRAYLPLGTELIDSDGFEAGSMEIYNEYGKTVIAGFISIEPGDIGNLHLHYQLPAEIDNKIKAGEYSLYCQKQPGNNINYLTVDLKFLSDIKSTYKPTGFNVTRNTSKEIRWEANLLNDKIFFIEL